MAHTPTTKRTATSGPARFPGAARRVLLSLAVFCAAFAVGLLAVGLVRDRQLQAQRSGTAEVASTVATSIEAEMSHALSTTYALAAYLRLTNWNQSQFDDIARELMSWNPAVESLQLAPDGIVSRAFPAAVAPKLIGHNLLTDPRQRAASWSAINTGKLTLSGPLTTPSGVVAMVGQLPVFRESHGGTRFWGFCVAAVGLDELLRAAQLDRLQQQGYRYSLSRAPSAAAPGEIIASSDDEPLPHPVKLSVSLASEQWVLAVAPAEGWRAVSWPLHGALIALISALAALLVFVSLRHSEAIAYLAFHDPLTGLSNRILLPDRFQQAMARARRSRQFVAVLLVDLDGFKEINDVLGHAAGDQVLTEVGRRLRAAVRDADTLVRLGGDEFVLIAADLFRAADWAPIAQKLIDALGPPIVFDGKQCAVTASVGASLAAAGTGDLDVLLGQADAALYEAKRAGKATYRLYGADDSDPPSGDRDGDITIEDGRVGEEPVAQHPRGQH